MPHMAGLAQADEICPGIGGFCAFKKPKRFFMMDWKAFADVPPAIIAIAALILNDSSARNEPTSAAICPGAANPVGRIFAFRLCFASAIHRTKSRNAILTRQPRFLVKAFAAVFARQRQSFLPSDVGAAPHIFGFERIGGPFPGAKFVSDKVGLGRGIEKCLGLPARAAGHAAKSCFLGPVGLNAKRRLADFAGFFNHAVTILKKWCIGKRTTLIACERVQKAVDQPDMFIAPPAPQPTQEGFDV